MFRLRSGQKGLGLRLHSLEEKLMETVWDRGFQAFSIRELHEELEKTRDIAYTTVLTTVTRLYKKGLFHRVRDGRRYLYTPKLTKEDFLRLTAEEVLKESLNAKEAFAMLADSVSEASMHELLELEEAILRRKKALLDKGKGSE